MHDRRIDGKTYVFGNAGGLWANAMTWWDHETRSIWSQPIGLALAGALKGTELTLLPVQITSWRNWKAAYPDTLIMTNDLEPLSFRRQGFYKDFIIGVVLDDQAKAYAYTDVEKTGVVNDWMGDFPVLVWALDEDYRAYSRQIGTEVLEFHLEDGVLFDNATGSTWDVRIGLAKDGPLKGQSLQAIPNLTAYDWAWSDFYPASAYYHP